MTWFRRPAVAASHAVAATVTGSDPTQSAAQLRVGVYELIRSINVNSGRLPGESVVMARRVTDALRSILDTADGHELDVHTALALRATIADYLPTTLATFLALDSSLVDIAGPAGQSPRQSLLTQLCDLWSAAAAVLVAARNSDADALLTQENFLHTKFSRSDLDL